MDFVIAAATPAKQRTGCIVAGVFEGRRLSPPALELDIAADGALAAIVQRGDLEG